MDFLRETSTFFLKDMIVEVKSPTNENNDNAENQQQTQQF
jgi:hypothetical protein